MDGKSLQNQLFDLSGILEVAVEPKKRGPNRDKSISINQMRLPEPESYEDVTEPPEVISGFVVEKDFARIVSCSREAAGVPAASGKIDVPTSQYEALGDEVNEKPIFITEAPPNLPAVIRVCDIDYDHPAEAHLATEIKKSPKGRPPGVGRRLNPGYVRELVETTLQGDLDPTVRSLYYVEQKEQGEEQIRDYFDSILNLLPALVLLSFFISRGLNGKESQEAFENIFPSMSSSDLQLLALLLHYDVDDAVDSPELRDFFPRLSDGLAAMIGRELYHDFTRENAQQRLRILKMLCIMIDKKEKPKFDDEAYLKLRDYIANPEHIEEIVNRLEALIQFYESIDWGAISYEYSKTGAKLLPKMLSGLPISSNYVFGGRNFRFMYSDLAMCDKLEELRMQSISYVPFALWDKDGSVSVVEFGRAPKIDLKKSEKLAFFLKMLNFASVIARRSYPHVDKGIAIAYGVCPYTHFLLEALAKINYFYYDSKTGESTQVYIDPSEYIGLIADLEFILETEIVYEGTLESIKRGEIPVEM